ncbi:MAG: hypothetical protein AMJ91_01025 [candidate division Zixibacteria bacterium SM23_73_3]|nr:MAG: hypothetical protein AMJ91_01025 [candidate division Zixibacteria bacterium SM23_73_3]
MKCPRCKEEIEDDAQKCKHCGSYVKVRMRIWATVKSILELLTFIAAIVVLYFMWQANRGMQEQLNLQRKSVEELSKQFIEEKRPRIEIIPTKIDVEDTSLLLYVDFENRGFADAEDLLLYVVLKYEDAPKDTLAVDLARVSKITKARRLTQTYSVSISKKVNLICLIEVRYTWTIQNLEYKRKKYFHFPYDKDIGKYRRLVLDEEQVKELWK